MSLLQVTNLWPPFTGQPLEFGIEVVFFVPADGVFMLRHPAAADALTTVADASADGLIGLPPAESPVFIVRPTDRVH